MYIHLSKWSSFRGQLYNIERFSGKKWKNVFRLSNEQVAKERGILIHSGSVPGQTVGCLMPGCEYGKDFVGGPKIDGKRGSQRKFDEISDYLNQREDGSVKFHMYNYIPEEEK